MERRQRMIWAATTAVSVAAFVGSGALWLHKASMDAVTAEVHELDQIAVQAELGSAEDTCAVFDCTTDETDDGLTFTVHR